MTPAERSQPMRVHLAILGTTHSHTASKLAAIRRRDDAVVLGAWEPDADVQRAHAAGAAFAGVRWFDSPEEMLAAPGLDGVVVDGLPRQNVSLAEAALRAGKPVLLEKPAGVDRGDFERLLTLAGDAGVFIQLGYQFRYMPAFAFARRIAREGLLGSLFLFRARIGKQKSAYAHLAEELPEYRGGLFYELGCHVLDMGIALMGPPCAVKSVLRSDGPAAPPFDDNCVAVVEFGSGIGVFETSAMEVSPRRRIEVYGTGGSLIIDSMMPPAVELCLAEAHPPYAEGWQTVQVGDDPMFSLDVDEFLAVIRGERAPAYSAEHDLATQNCLLDICGG